MAQERGWAIVQSFLCKIETHGTFWSWIEKSSMKLAWYAYRIHWKHDTKMGLPFTWRWKKATHQLWSKTMTWRADCLLVSCSNRMFPPFHRDSCQLKSISKGKTSINALRKNFFNWPYRIRVTNNQRNKNVITRKEISWSLSILKMAIIE